MTVDRTQAQAMGLDVTDVYKAISLLLAAVYVDNFIYAGRVKRVYMQADGPYRMGPEALQHIYTPSSLIGPSNGMTAASGTADTGNPLTQVNSSVSNTSISPYNMIPISSVVTWNIDPAPSASDDEITGVCT